jgi:hypothetical protein
MADAMRSWIAWKKGHHEQVEELAGSAIGRWQVMGEQWGASEYHYPFRWVCVWPLIAARLTKRDFDQAIEAAQQLLEVPQMRIPKELEMTVEALIRDWHDGRGARAVERLAEALGLAEQLGFA